jgi:hypothetical protein
MSGAGELPATVRRLLDDHHSGGVRASDCLRCPAPCCMQSGFALRENVERIHERYRAGGLARDGFRFPPGLNLAGFVAAYFDVTRQGPLTLYHPRSLGPTGEPIAVPPSDDYFETRAALFDGNLWLNRGCVFLSRSRPPWPEDDDRCDRRCILHEPGSEGQLGAKPIDCLFLTCDRRGEIREPSPRLSEQWFEALARAFAQRGSRTGRESGPRSRGGRGTGRGQRSSR